MKYSELIRRLEQGGWVVISQRGSHMKMKHPDYENILIVPNHTSKEIGKGLATAILKQVRIIK